MTELHWTPDQVGRMTLVQLLCLGQERPPGQRKLEAEDLGEILERKRRENEAWASGVEDEAG